VQKTGWVSGAIGALSVSWLVGCGEDDKAPLRIGASLPETGDFAQQGNAAMRGYQAWAAIANDSGGLLGRSIELVLRDNGSDAEVASTDYEELITVEKVDLVVGTFSSRLVIPTSAVAAEHGYAYVEPAGGSPQVFDRGLTNLFFAQPAPSSQSADAFVEYIAAMPDGARPQTFGVATLDDPFATGVRDSVIPALVSAGLALVFDETYSETTEDFSGIAERVHAVDPDLIVGCTQFEDSVGQLLAYQAVGYAPRGAFMSNGPTVPPSFRGAMGNATEGIFSAISWYPETQDYQNAEFVSRHIQLFGGTAEDVAEDAANAFTVGQVLQQAVERIGSVDNASLIEELHRGTYQTVVGPLSFDDVGRPEGKYMILQWQGDNFVIVAPADRRQLAPIWPKPAW
jgi:branched-chain amino acid transport system substrate-binding protein